MPTPVSAPASQERIAEQATAALKFITQYVAIHKRPPSVQHVADGCHTTTYRARQAITRLRRHHLLSQTALRPVHPSVAARFQKPVEDR